MEQTIKGIDKILMFRGYDHREDRKATRLALQTTHTIKETAKTSEKATKDGNVVSPGDLSTSIDIEAMASDTEVNKLLHWASKYAKRIEVWEIDFTKPAKTNVEGSDPKYLSQYGTGYLSGWESPAGVSDDTTLKSTISIDGKLVSGWATVTKDQELEVQKFRDTINGATEVDGLDEDPYASETVEDGEKSGN